MPGPAHKPSGIKLPDGSLYVACVVRIDSRDENGRPEALTYIPQDRTVELSPDGGDEFLIAYILDRMVKSHDQG